MAKAKRKLILIVDDEAEIVRMVEALMLHVGHRVVTAAHGRAGLDAARSAIPDLIISDVLMPEMDGWTFVRELRSDKRLALTPVIFLTALSGTQDRIKGFRLGADDYLAKPFHMEELALRVARVLRSGERIQRELTRMANERAVDEAQTLGLKGSLTHIGVSALLTVMEMERKSGILVLRNEKQTARIFFAKGRVLDARFEGQPTPRGERAVYELLRWSRGRFDFSDVEVDMEDEVKTSTTHLLMEGARLIDEGD